MNDKITPEEFEQKLKKHDWYYMMSDSANKRETGQEAQDQLANIANSDPKLKKLFVKYHKKHFSNK